MQGYTACQPKPDLFRPGPSQFPAVTAAFPEGGGAVIFIFLSRANPVKFTGPDGRDIDLLSVKELLSKSEEGQAAIKALNQGDVKLQIYDSYTVTRQFYTDFTYAVPDGSPRTNKVKGYFDPITNAIAIDATMSSEDIASTIVHEYIHSTQDKRGITGIDKEYEAFTKQALFDFDIGRPFEHPSFEGQNRYEVINYNAIVRYVDRLYGYRNGSPLPVEVLENKTNLRDIDF
jgi:hypothetical protein